MQHNTRLLRIGISMRVTNIADYSETRDSLSRDWQTFLTRQLPKAISMPIPNVGSSVITNIVEPWQLNGFILTGGEDLNMSRERDDTENAILTYAIDNHLPVLAICRGFQLLQNYFGGRLTDCDPQTHTATHHQVTAGKIRFKVNSYHTKAILTENLAPCLKAIALAPDQTVEAAAMRFEPVLAFMWHPERATHVGPFEHELIQNLFVKNSLLPQ